MFVVLLEWLHWSIGKSPSRDLHSSESLRINRLIIENQMDWVTRSK